MDENDIKLMMELDRILDEARGNLTGEEAFEAEMAALDKFEEEMHALDDLIAGKPIIVRNPGDI